MAGMPELTINNHSELYQDVLNSVNKNAFSEMSENIPCNKPDEITRFS